MSINIHNVILHQLHKNDQEELTLHCSSEPLEQSVCSESLVVRMHSAFSSKQKGFAFFKEDSQFKELLSEYRSGVTGFYEFTSNAAKSLRDELSKYPFSDEGTVVFAEYQYLATDYLLVSIIPSSPTLAVDSELNLAERDHLEVTATDIVAQIDLTRMEVEGDSNRYLTFLKGRVGRKISDFFLDFLSAEVGLNPKANTQVMAQAVSDFCSDSNLDREDTQSIKKAVSEFCKGSDEVKYKELSQEIPANNDGVSFSDYIEEQGYELEESFPPNQAALRHLTKFCGAGGGLNITFDSLLLGERIFYCAETDTITIKGTPPNIRDQLTRHALAGKKVIQPTSKTEEV